MIKRLLLYALVGAILLAVAISADSGYKDTALLEQYAAQISTYLTEQETRALDWARRERTALDAASDGKTTPSPKTWANTLTEQATEPYTLLLHQNDSLLFWSNNKALPVRETLEDMNRGPRRSVVRLPLGYYYAFREDFGAAGKQLSLLIPIRFTLDEQGRRQQPLFPADASIPGQTELSFQKPAPHAIRVGGQDLCGLQAPTGVQAPWVQWLKLLAYGLLLGLAMAVTFEFALQWSRHGWALAGAALLLALVVAVVWLNRQTGFTQHQFSELPLFARQFESPSLVGNSLGDWLLYLLLLLWLMVYFHRGFHSDALHHFPLPVRLTIGMVYYLLTMLSLPAGMEMYRQLVFHSSINFDFDNLLNFDAFAALALAGVVLLAIALFLFGHRLILTTSRLQLPATYRIAGIALSALIVYGISLGFESTLRVEPLYVAAFALLYVGAFDFFMDWKTPGFGGGVLWLLFFSLASALLLYRYNYLKDRDVRFSYSESLAVDRDTALAEPQLKIVQRQFARDSGLNRLLKPWPFKPQTAELRRHLNDIVFPQNYLFQHYRLAVYAFDEEGLVLPQDQAKGRDYVLTQNWQAGTPLPEMPEIRYHTDEEGIFRYMLRVRAYRMGDSSQPADVYCFFDHQYPRPTLVYAELFYNLPYKNLQRLTQYGFAVSKRGKLVVDQGKVNQLVFRQTLPGGQAVETESETPRRVAAVYKSPDGQTIAAVGRPMGGWYKQLYLFAVLFALTSLLLFALALANTYLGFLPDYYQFHFSTKGSLAKRIHYGNIALIGVAFIGIGWLTYQHFDSSAQEAERTELDNRANAVLTHLRTKLGGLAPESDSLLRVLPETLAPLAASLSMDVNLFSPRGDLLFSTQENLAQLGVLPCKISPVAWAALVQGNAPESVVAEQVAGVEFSSRYLPLRNSQNQLLGFLNVPFHLTERKIGSEVSDFIGMLASVYVFLLLIAYSVSFLLSQSIIRPLQLISNKIKQLQFEDKNQPLEYQGDAQDELSALIEEYNRMVEKLEDSKVQLIRLERESAWREMARQVAHDIKNPLTTMKLSMQQLERVSSEPAQAAAYLKKAITRLIEQIDSLAQIASEFSMFANLDIQQKHDMVLNDVVESVFDLFSEQKGVDLNLHIPPERYHISGDKNHLIRVFNNLIINAIQAIPSDRRGQIRVSLYRADQRAVVQISDNGGGIPPEIQKRVFEPNFTTKTSGSGLGLAICRKIVEALDGTIRFETRENAGTDFFVEFPITATESAEVVEKVMAG